MRTQVSSVWELPCSRGRNYNCKSGVQEIAEYYLQSKPVDEGVSAEVLARKTPGFSGAQIANMINEAALAAAKCGADVINNAMLDEARDKVMMGRERTLTRSEVRFLPPHPRAPPPRSCESISTSCL